VSLLVGAVIIGAATLAGLLWMRWENHRDQRDIAEHEQWELARRTPGAAYAACDDHNQWIHDLPQMPPHKCGTLTRRRHERTRLHRELELMLCLAAANRPKDDA